MTDEHFDIVPTDLAIKAMRASGFKSTDHAIAEIIDNSIQAGIKFGNETTNVEVICIETSVQLGQRISKRISEIAVFDNAGGMDPELLRKALMFGHGTNLVKEQQKGIGKFGMGLPNASISQCQFVEVYSWKDNKVFKTHLDIDKIYKREMREVPQPIETDLPPKYKNLIKSKIGESGTLVIWKDLDRTTWVRHQAFFKNSEFLIGRIYRRYIADGSATIRFAAYDASTRGDTEFLAELFVRSNDPLMLTKGTSAPGEYSEDAAFEEFGKPDLVTLTLPDNTKSVVVIRYAVAKLATRVAGEGRSSAGSTPIGKYLKRNVGVSIVRAGRELVMNTSWVNPGDTRERWWGIEIEFQPELDDIFGVSNDKQAANNLYMADYKDDAEALELKPSELMEQLAEARDPKQANYKISARIAARLSSLRAHIVKQKAGSQTHNNKKKEAELTATRAAALRSKNNMSQADIDFSNATNEEKKEAIKSAYVDVGLPDDMAESLAVEAIDTGIRFNFVEASLTSPTIFDWSQDRGEYFIQLNIKHPAYPNFIELLKNNKETSDSRELVALKLLLTAWVRMEEEAQGGKLDELQDTRLDWGRMARDFLREIE